MSNARNHPYTEARAGRERRITSEAHPKRHSRPGGRCRAATRAATKTDSLCYRTNTGRRAKTHAVSILYTPQTRPTPRPPTETHTGTASVTTSRTAVRPHRGRIPRCRRVGCRCCHRLEWYRNHCPASSAVNPATSIWINLQVNPHGRPLATERPIMNNGPSRLCSPGGGSNKGVLKRGETRANGMTATRGQSHAKRERAKTTDGSWPHGLSSKLPGCHSLTANRADGPGPCVFKVGLFPSPATDRTQYRLGSRHGTLESSVAGSKSVVPTGHLSGLRTGGAES